MSPRSGRTIGILLGALLQAGCAGGPEAHEDGAGATALLGATILDGTGGAPIEDGALVFSGDRIDCVGARGDCPLPEGAEVHDLSGRFLTPGLIDAHVHLSQTGWLDGRPDGIDLRERYPYETVARELRENPDRWFRTYLCAGVTGMFDVGGFRWTVALADRVEEDPDAPHLRAAGPLISHARLDVLRTEDDDQFFGLESPEAGREAVRELAAVGADAVKVWYLSPPPERWDEIEARVRAVAEEAERTGLPLLVHATELRAAKVAVDAGAFMLVHSVWDAEVDDELVSLMRERGTLYAPTLVVPGNWGRAIEAAARGTVPEWEDPLGCVDPWTERKLRDAPELPALIPEGRFTAATFEAGRERRARADAVAAANLRRLHTEGITVVVATDAGNPLTLHGASYQQELEAMESAGIPPRELLVMATRNGARALDAPELGTLEPGKVADVLVLSRDPRETIAHFRSLEAVIHRGAWREAGERSAAGRVEGSAAGVEGSAGGAGGRGAAGRARGARAVSPRASGPAPAGDGPS